MSNNTLSVKRKSYTAIMFVLLTAALILSIIFVVSIGSVKLEFKTVYLIIKEVLTGGNAADNPGWTSSQYHIVWDVRVPRVFLGALAGGGLAVCGAVMQALVLNPIADPYILGVSSGASAGAALALLTPITLFSGTGQVTALAFIGAIVAVVLVYSMSRLGKGTGVQSVSLILSGTAVNAVMTAVSNLLIFMAKSPESIANVYYWQMGSIASAQWKTLPFPATAVFIGFIILASQSMKFNILMMGEEDATAMGINIKLFKAFSIFVVAVIIASLVSVTGVIGFVGLIVPHIVRMLVKTSDNRVVIPCCLLAGALFLIWADAMARGLFGATEVPLGIITAFIGAPFFVFLLSKQSRNNRRSY